MLLLRPIMALSTSGAKGSVGSNSLSASASVAAILPRDSHRTFFESRDWNFVERHWAAAARTGDPALPLTTAASWADLRVDPPPGDTVAADATTTAAAGRSSSLSNQQRARPKLSVSPFSSADATDSGVYDAIAADWQHLLNDPSFLNPLLSFSSKDLDEVEYDAETRTLDSRSSVDSDNRPPTRSDISSCSGLTDSSSSSNSNVDWSAEQSSSEEMKAPLTSSRALKKQMKKEKKQKQPKGERATYFLTVGYAGSAFQGWASNEKKSHKNNVNNNNNNKSTIEILKADSKTAEAPKEGTERQEFELRERAGNLGGSSDRICPTMSSAPLPSVAGTLANALKPLLGANAPPRVDVAGRTDAGVSAIAQVCSFYTWEQGLLDGHNLDENSVPTKQQRQVSMCQAIGAAVAQHAAALGLPLHAHRVQRVDRVWHPRWSARHRRYAYLMPLDLDPHYDITANKGASRSKAGAAAAEIKAAVEDSTKSTAPSDVLTASSSSSPPFAHMDSLTMDAAAMAALVVRVNDALQEVVAAGPMSCNALAYGKLQVGKKLLSKEEAADGGANDLCRLLEAKATLVEWPLGSSPTSGMEDEAETVAMASVQYALPSSISPPAGSSSSFITSSASTAAVRRCLLVELVGDRFLRRMVRVLVATVVRQALLEADLVEAQEEEEDEETSTDLDSLEDRLHAGRRPVENGRMERSEVSEAGVNTRRGEPRGTGAPPLSLLEIVASGNRSLAAHPAPAVGLAFLGAGFAREEGWPSK